MAKQLEPTTGDVYQTIQPRDVCIVSAVRTPIGCFGGALSPLSATQLGAIVIKEAVSRSGLSADDVEEVYMGCVLTAGLGQAPARQAAVFAGLPHKVTCTTVNKVCASGMKCVMFGAQSIMLGQSEVVVAGGMESMSNAPYYLKQARFGLRMGNSELVDGMVKDGLWDVYHDHHMGCAGELCARNHNISRHEQDAHAAESYRRAAQATRTGLFDTEIVPVEVPGAKGKPPVVVKEDEEFSKVDLEKMGKLRPAFDPTDGTITAANSSKLSDGAAALVLVSGAKAAALRLPVLAVVRSFADAEQEPDLFTTSPSLAIPKALSRAGLSRPSSAANGIAASVPGVDDVDLWEVNEAFSVVALANARLLGLPLDRVNVHGGAVALGHPLGCSGARIVVTLIHALRNRHGKIGVAGVCNGGGGASAMVIERV